MTLHGMPNVVEESLALGKVRREQMSFSKKGSPKYWGGKGILPSNSNILPSKTGHHALATSCTQYTSDQPAAAMSLGCGTAGVRPEVPPSGCKPASCWEGNPVRRRSLGFLRAELLRG